MDLIEENASTELIGKLMPSWQPMDPMNLDYYVSVKLENIVQNERNIVGILIELKRKFGRNFIELILPPSLLVLVSWVSLFRTFHCTNFSERILRLLPFRSALQSHLMQSLAEWVYF